MKKIVNENNKTNFYTGLAKRTAILSLTGAMVFSMAGGTFGTTSVNAATTCNVNSSTASVSVKNPSVFDTVTITAAKKAITKLTVIVNGTTLSKKAYKIKNTKNYSKNVIMVPLKAVAKELGMKVTKVSNGVYTLTTGSDESTITVGKDAYSYATTIDGACGATGIFTLGAAPAIKNKTLYVPASFIKCLYGNNDDLVSVSKNTISFHINDSEEDVSIPNPITTHATLADLSAAVGFTVKVPTAVVDSTTAVYDDISGTFAHVR